MKTWIKIVLVVGLIVAISVLGLLTKKGLMWTPGKLLKPAPAPVVSGKIKGYWSSGGPNAFDELGDVKEMKAIGINTITFSPMLSHSQEGRVKELPGSESYIKKTINKAHRAGIRVMLETTPMNGGAVSPKVTDPKLFQSEMTKIALKYAKIANEYNVEFFAPIVEPGHHISDEEADVWLQELLPKLRQVYNGKLMWKKQATDLEAAKDWKQDHILTVGFYFDGNDVKIQFKQLLDHALTLNLGSQTISFEEYSKQTNKFSDKKNIKLTSGWHELKIKIENNSIAISIDGEKLFEKQDDSGPMGGYIFSGPVRINKLEITDKTGKILYAEKFNNLNSFSARSGISLGNGEIIIAEKSEAKLIHDINFGGYDYIAMDTFHRGKAVTIDEYINFLRYYIQKTNDQAKADGVPNVILAEFGGSLKENIGWRDADERAKIPLTEDELAQTVTRVLQLAEPEVDGYIYNGWNIEKQGLNKLPKVKAVIRDWYLNY